MSERKAKELRKQMADGTVQPQPKVVHYMKVIAYDDGTVKVKNFPLELGEALDLLATATKQVVFWYARNISEGRAAQGSKSNIVVPQHPGILVP